MRLQAYATGAHWTAQEKGFYDDEFTVESALAKMMLIVSEVAEVMEALRKQHGSAKIAEEMADTFIRLADLYAALQENGYIYTDLDFDKAVAEKMAINAGRQQKHVNLI